ncbi:MAG: DUF3833 domain-containing protein [Pseudomonadota bacterium]
MNLPCLPAARGAPARRRVLSALAAAGAFALVGCASPRIEDHANDEPVLDLREYFDGRVRAYGVFHDRFSRLQRRFIVEIDGRWQGDVGTLDERFAYPDGTTSRRVWTLRREADGRYTGTAADVVGTAVGQARGNALRWRYTLQLPVGDRVYDVQFDDWMYLMDGRVMLNKAVMSKFGIRLGEVTLTFVKE